MQANKTFLALPQCNFKNYSINRISKSVLQITDHVFTPSIYGPRAKSTGHETKGIKRESVNHSIDREDEVSKIFIIAELRRPEGPPSGAPYSYGKEKETHELIFSWLLWLAVLLVGAYARRRRRRRHSRTTWRPYSK